MAASHEQPDEHHTDDTITAVADERPRLMNLAYRFLGSVTEAEDAVQETFARWYAMTAEQQATIETPGAWLTTVISRICLDVLGSARARRERYVGEWVPEPLPPSADWPGAPRGDVSDPAERVTLDESITIAFLVVLEAMTPAQRVAFVLHDVFGYAFPQVAEITGRTPAACRRLASSARRRVRAARPPAAASARAAAVVEEFMRAWRARDVRALVDLLEPDATAITDGGGLVSAAPRPIEGADDVARYYVDLAARTTDLTIAERTVNGRPGLVALRDGGAVVTVFAFDLLGDRIKHIWAIRNPDKLRHWTET